MPVCKQMEIFMNATLADYFEDFESVNVEPSAPKPKRKTPQKHRPETDILLWLAGNAPVNFQNLADLRYCLYHRCSRTDFTVKRWDKDDFNLTGRSSSLHIVSNKARRFLLWQLRILAGERGWRGALPRSRAALTKPSLYGL